MKQWKFWCLMGASLIATTPFVPLEAVALQERIYLELPWGDQPEQISRSLPNPKQDDVEAAGPVSFAIGRAGDVYISDLQEQFRVQIFDHEGQLKKLLPFSQEKGEYVESLEVDATGRVYMLGSFGWTADHKLNGRLRIYDPPQWNVAQTIDLQAKGLWLPLDLELGQDQEMFIQDNATFLTAELDKNANILVRIPDDRLFWLASRGLYGFQHKNGQVTVYAHYGQRLGRYLGDQADFTVAGVDPEGNLYVIYRSQEKGPLTLAVLSQKGPLFSVPLTTPLAKQMLDPGRQWDGRVIRMGPDGAIYAMGPPEDNKFRIYRFQVQP